MKKEIHPDYHPVVFRDIGADYSFLTRSTATSNQTVKWEDGNEYPLINIDISSKSHPFYTGQQRFEKLVAVLKNSIDVMEKQQNKMKSRVVMPLFLLLLRGKFCDILVTVMFYSGYIMIMSKN